MRSRARQEELRQLKSRVARELIDHLRKNVPDSIIGMECLATALARLIVGSAVHGRVESALEDVIKSLRQAVDLAKKPEGLPN